MTSERPWLCALPAICVSLLILLPFLGMAYTVDDVTFLLQAKHVLVDPLHPTAFDMVADSERIRLSQQLVSGPVMAYLLVPSILLGGAEWAAHVVQILLLILALSSTASLALRLGLNRTQATLAPFLIVASPAVLGMSTTAMPDVAAMAFAVLGVERLFASIERDSLLDALVAAVVLAIAALCRPHVLLVLPCAGLSGLAFAAERTRVDLRTVLRLAAPLVLAFLIWGTVVLVTRDPASGQTVTVATFQRMNRLRLLFNLASFSINWVVAFPLGLLWPVLRGRDYPNMLRSAAAFTIGMTIVSDSLYADFSWWLVILAMVLAGLGIDIFFDIIGDAFYRRDWIQVGLVAWMGIALAATFYMHLPPKDLVPSTPAMAILLARKLRGAEISAQYRSIGIASLAGLVLGVLIIRADARLAEVGRIGGRIAGQLVRQGNRVWVDGSWGHQWYGMQEGAETLATTAPFPRANDVIVRGLNGLLVDRYPDKVEGYQRSFVGPAGWVQGEGAGFFSNYGGPLPWVWSEKEYGRIEVWRLRSNRQVR